MRSPNRPPCSVRGCEILTVGKGFCDTHYRRFRKHGSAEDIKLPTPEERFWSYVDKNGPVPEKSPDLGRCWIWTGSLVGTSTHPYGAILVNKKQMKAHRYSLILHGIDPEGFMSCHKCDNTQCVNPDHLYLGDAFSNMADMVHRERQHMATGIHHHSTKVTDDQIEEMKALRASGKYFIKDIAQMYNISQGHVSALTLDSRRTPEARESRKRRRSAVWKE